MLQLDGITIKGGLPIILEIGLTASSLTIDYAFRMYLLQLIEDIKNCSKIKQ